MKTDQTDQTDQTAHVSWSSMIGSQVNTEPNITSSRDLYQFHLRANSSSLCPKIERTLQDTFGLAARPALWDVRVAFHPTFRVPFLTRLGKSVTELTLRNK